MLDPTLTPFLPFQAEALHSSLSHKRKFRDILARVRSRGTLADQIAAIDCEMVGVGKRRQSELVRGDARAIEQSIDQSINQSLNRLTDWTDRLAPRLA